MDFICCFFPEKLESSFEPFFLKVLRREFFRKTGLKDWVGIGLRLCFIAETLNVRLKVFILLNISFSDEIFI